MNPRPLSHPRLPGELVESMNALVSAGPIEVPGEGEAAACILASPARGAYDACLTLDIGAGGASLKVALNSLALTAALGDLISRQDFARLDDELQLAVLDTALAGPMQALANLFSVEVVLDGLLPNNAPEEDDEADSDAATAEDPRESESMSSLLVEVRAATGVALFSVLVELQSPLPSAMLEALGQAPEPPRQDLDALPIPVTFELGSTTVSAADLGSLAPGDILLFEESYVAQDQLRVNICDQVFFAASLDGFSLRVETQL